MKKEKAKFFSVYMPQWLATAAEETAKKKGFRSLNQFYTHAIAAAVPGANARKFKAGIEVGLLD